MIGKIILVLILCLLALLAVIGAAALFLLICTIKDDMELEERKRNKKTSD